MAGYVQTFIVQGRGNFPMDMLRYDHCWPKHSEDAVNMTVCTLSADTGGLRLIELCRHVDLKRNEPTYQRWSSLGWEVLKQSIRTFK